MEECQKGGAVKRNEYAERGVIVLHVVFVCMFTTRLQIFWCEVFGLLWDGNMRKVRPCLFLCFFSVCSCWARVQEVQDILAAPPGALENSAGYEFRGAGVLPWSLYLVIAVDATSCCQS